MALGTPTTKDKGSDTATLSSKNTGAFTAAAFELITVWIVAYRDDSTSPTNPTVTHDGVTATAVAGVNFDTSPTSMGRYMCFRFTRPTASSSGALTMNFGAQSIEALNWIVIGQTGAMIVQAVTNNETGGAPSSGTLSAFGGAGGRPMAGFCNNGNTADAYTLEAGWTKVDNVNSSGTPAATQTVGWHSTTQDTQTDWTSGFGGGNSGGSIIIEVGQLVTGAASVSGSGTIASSGVRTRLGAASVSGAGTVVAAGVRTRLGAASISGAGTIVAAADVTPGGSVVTGAASITGAGSIAASAVRVRLGAATVAGTGTVAATGIRTRFGVGSIAGAGTIAASATRSAVGAAALSGAGAVAVATTKRTTFGEVAIEGSGEIAVDGDVVRGHVSRRKGTDEYAQYGLVSRSQVPGRRIY